MRHFKYLIFLFTVMLLLGCSIGSTKNKDLTVAENSIVYATDILFDVDQLNVKVGDSIKLSDINVNLLPVNTKVKTVLELVPSNKATLVNDVVTFVDEGEVEFVAKALCNLKSYISKTLKCVISSSDVYATNVEFDCNEVVLDLNETAVNKLNINPTEYNQDVEINYVDNNIVATYDYLTGVVTPLKEGAGTINVKVKSGKTTTLSDSFKVVVTNNVYAEQITNVKANNVMLGSEITLFVGETGSISYNVLPSTFNKLSAITTSNNLITINNNGSFVVGNSVGICDIVISAQTKTGYLTKTIRVNIVKEPENIDLELKYNNETVTDLYSNTCYTAHILTPLQNYSNILFENCEFEYVSNNIYKLKFITAGNVSINASTTIFGTLTNKIVNSTSKFKVYNVINDVNFALNNNNVEIIPNKGVYTLYLPNLDKLSEAISQKELVYADVSVGAKGLYMNSNSLSYKIEGDSVVLNGNRIIANKLGTSKIVVSSSDFGMFSREYVVEVKPLEVREILLDSTEITLLLNGNNNDNSVILTPTIVPSCAYNTAYEFVSTSINISITDNKITALFGGNAVVKILSGNVQKIVNISVNYVPTHILAKFNNVEVENGNVYICEVNNINSLTANVYSNEVLLANKNITISINSNFVSTEEISKLCFSETGNYNVVISHENLVLSFTIKVELINKISNFKFEEDSCDVNIYFTQNLVLNYSYDVQFPQKPISDVLRFENSNSGVAVLSGNNLTLVGIGTTTICAYVNDDLVDEFVVNVYNKEIKKINSLSDFYNIQDGKYYVVESNLDFAGFSVGSGKSFNGEIDFNNKKITNLKTSLFDVLGKNAIISNLNISGNVTLDSNSFVGDIDEQFAIVATQNNGTIKNVIFENLTLTINNSQEKTSLITSLIVFNNYGEISNISYNNVKIIVSDTGASSINGYIVSAGVSSNHGTINCVNGGFEVSGFTKFGGLAINNFNLLQNISLNFILNCTQENKIQIGALSHKNCNYGETTPELNNVVLNVTINNLSHCTDLKFGGLAFTNQICEGGNVNAIFTFNGDFNTSKTFLMFYSTIENNLKDVEIKSNKDFNY